MDHNCLGSLPNEVMMEILLRLPVECLIISKSVSKSWYDTINDPEFATKHLLFSVQQQNLPNASTTILFKCLMLKDSGTKQNTLSFLTFANNNDGGNGGFTVDDNFDVPFFEDSLSMDFSGHSHGILCLSECHDEIFLYNPATRELYELPPSILLLKQPPREFDGFSSDTERVGFGYDSKSNDFKVVRVVNYTEGPFCYPDRAEVYSLSTGQWRELKNPPCAYVLSNPSFEMFYEGIYYWHGNKLHGNREVIESFDMSKEEFQMLAVPESFKEFDHKCRSLGVWNGLIILFNYPYFGDEKSFDMWVMEKNNKGEISWSMLMTLGPISGVETPLLFMHNSNELLMEAKDGHVVSYNIDTQHQKQLPIKGEPRRFQAANFIKTLLSIRRGTKF